MKLEILADADSVARRAAAIIADAARNAVVDRGRFVLAVSGGRTPWEMMRAFSGEDVPWAGIRIVQVDERVAPDGDADRNLTHLRACLPQETALLPIQIYPMPVGQPDLRAAADDYSRTLEELAGRPAVLDLVHLGLGSDGHTASLVPGDPVLDALDVDVASTGIYQGRPRLTLTYPAINRARCILWVVTGSEKMEMLSRLYRGDRSIPAGRVARERAWILADRAAGENLVPAV